MLETDLYKSFNSLTNPILSIGFQDILITPEDINFSKENAGKLYRFNRNKYLDFLNACQNYYLKNQGEIRLLDVVFDSLSEDDYITYDHLTQCLSFRFKDQQDASGIATMGIFFIGRPKLFTAFLRYLLQHQITPEWIISTHILHCYFSSYMDVLNKPNNPIEELYELLSLFPDSKPLGEMARQISCDSRGFECYSVDGTMHSSSDILTKVDRIEVLPLFSPTENNLKSLNGLFRDEFLICALYQWKDQENTAEWITDIQSIFNQQSIITTQLPLVLKRLHELPMLAKPLSQILNNQSLSTLMERHVVGLLSLTPFCPELINMMQPCDLSAYIQTVQAQNNTGPALFSSLFSFFQSIKEINEPSSLMVLDAMLDAIHIDDSVLDDGVMIGKLRKMKHCKEIINKKVAILEERLNQIIQTSIAIDEMDYISMEDGWRDAFAKIRHFKQIEETFETNIPLNKYILYANIARAFIQREPVEFDVQAFSLTIRVEPIFDLKNITPYERLIIELLSTIDHEAVRVNCINILDENVNHSARSWRTSNYDNECLFKKATLAGNRGFIQWMYVNKIDRRFSYDDLTYIAAYKNHWALVSYYYVKHQLKPSTVNMLFDKAVSLGRLSDIPVLWMERDKKNQHFMPDKALISGQFNVSIKNNHLGNIPCFFAWPDFKAMIETTDKQDKKKLIRKITQAFNSAVNSQYFEMVKILAEGSVGEMLRPAINQALKDAARLDNCDLIKTLRQLSSNGPGQNARETALFRAVRANKLAAVKELVVFSAKSPRLQVIQEARLEANKKNLPEIESFLSNLYESTNRPFENDTKSTDSLSQLNSTPRKRSIKHATSCNSMSSLQRMGFFPRVKSGSLSPVLSEELSANPKLCGNRALVTK